MPATSTAQRKIMCIAYAAGIIDGEGCISIQKSRVGTSRSGFIISSRVTVANSSELLINWLQANYGGVTRSYPQKHGGWKRCYYWTLTGKDAASFLKTILPCLKLKREQAKIAITFARHLGTTKALPEEEIAFREAQYILMKKLNEKGVKDAC